MSKQINNYLTLKIMTKRCITFDDVRKVQTMKSQIWEILAEVEFSCAPAQRESLEYTYAELHLLEHQLVKAVIGRFPKV